MITREHCVATLLDAGLSSQRDQQVESLTTDTVLAVVDVEITGVHRQLGSASRILVEEFPKVNGVEIGVMSAQFLPG